MIFTSKSKVYFVIWQLHPNPTCLYESQHLCHNAKLTNPTFRSLKLTWWYYSNMHIIHWLYILKIQYLCHNLTVTSKSGHPNSNLDYISVRSLLILVIFLDLSCPYTHFFAHNLRFGHSNLKWIDVWLILVILLSYLDVQMWKWTASVIKLHD